MTILLSNGESRLLYYNGAREIKFHKAPYAAKITFEITKKLGANVMVMLESAAASADNPCKPGKYSVLSEESFCDCDADASSTYFNKIILSGDEDARICYLALPCVNGMWIRLAVYNIGDDGKLTAVDTPIDGLIATIQYS